MPSPRGALSRYGLARMRSVGEIVRARLAQIRMFQKDFAALVNLDPTGLSRILDGERRLPVEDAVEWCEALRLTGKDAEELVQAIHLSWSTNLIAALVDRLTAEKADALAVIAFCEDKARMIRRFLDAMDRIMEDFRKRRR
jgi:transcriptional regulator with XRE-family HTH domain